LLTAVCIKREHLSMTRSGRHIPHFPNRCMETV
jgi:hypothetical protein